MKLEGVRQQRRHPEQRGPVGGESRVCREIATPSVPRTPSAHRCRGVAIASRDESRGDNPHRDEDTPRQSRRQKCSWHVHRRPASANLYSARRHLSSSSYSLLERGTVRDVRLTLKSLLPDMLIALADHYLKTIRIVFEVLSRAGPSPASRAFPPPRKPADPQRRIGTKSDPRFCGTP